jgi:hypothetical protein
VGVWAASASGRYKPASSRRVFMHRKYHRRLDQQVVGPVCQNAAGGPDSKQAQPVWLGRVVHQFRLIRHPPLGIYARVVETRFECVIISLVVLMYWK